MCKNKSQIQKKPPLKKNFKESIIFFKNNPYYVTKIYGLYLMENSVLIEKKYSLENPVFVNTEPGYIKTFDNSDQDPNKLSEFSSKEEGKEIRSSKVTGNKSNENFDIEASDKEKQNEDKKTDFQSKYKEVSERSAKSHENLANSSQDPEKFVESEDPTKEEWTKEKFDEDFVKEIEFSIEYSTVFGEKIVVIGSTDELGNWEVSKGLELT